ncbi:hypothetical protein GEMRC1_010192 [Eukaryota sp. GEM-RC1]
MRCLSLHHALPHNKHAVKLCLLEVGTQEPHVISASPPQLLPSDIHNPTNQTDRIDVLTLIKETFQLQFMTSSDLFSFVINLVGGSIVLLVVLLWLKLLLVRKKHDLTEDELYILDLITCLASGDQSSDEIEIDLVCNP